MPGFLVVLAPYVAPIAAGAASVARAARSPAIRQFIAKSADDVSAAVKSRAGRVYKTLREAQAVAKQRTDTARKILEFGNPKKPARTYGAFELGADAIQTGADLTKLLFNTGGKVRKGSGRKRKPRTDSKVRKGGAIKRTSRKTSTVRKGGAIKRRKKK